MASKRELVFAFDFGTGSLGEAVRKGDFIVATQSLLIDDEVGKISEQRKRRRAKRTREAHKKREKSLQRICNEAGIPVLAHNDERMQREFPKSGDDTCYTSCLLRIKLLRGEQLEGWQIYKALHSAIQRRGYDQDVPWKNKEEEKKEGGKKTQEEQKFEEKAEEFKEEFGRLPEDCRYPCYFDAWKMGLWNAKDKDAFRMRIDCRAERARDHIIQREPVLREVEALLSAAARFYPKLQGRVKEAMFGEGGIQYASYDAELRKRYGLRRGSERDWDGVMGQKVPRFDNRIISKCVLMPRRNVCRADDGLVQQVLFLLKLKNMRFERGGRDDMLSAAEMKRLLQTVMEEEKKKPKKEGPFKRTPTQWKKFVISIGGNPKSGEDKVDHPSRKGRARFCRPALRLLRELLTTGMSPGELHARCRKEISEGSLKLNDDDIAFLQTMPQTWESFYIPDSSMDTLLERAQGDIDRAIVMLISEQINPVVRHRLFFFYKELQRLHDNYGEPDKVALEFVRDDFMGEKAKKAYSKFLDDRTKNNKKADEELEKFGLSPTSKNRLKMKLFIEQGKKCLYTEDDLSERLLESYDVDHVVPRSKNGSDSYLNYVLTTSDTNQKKKGNRTPYEWLKRGGGWEAYLKRVEAANISKKKKRLLTAENAAELDEKYTTLAETAWIARLARKIVCLYFAWPEGKAGQERKCQIVSGGLTARFRARYKLNGILVPDDAEPKDRDKKYRADKRHHALDAMVLSYIPNWAADKSKRRFWELPESLGNQREYFARQLADVVPETVFRNKPRLEETFYAKRIIDDREQMTCRRKLKSLPYKTANNKEVFDPKKNGGDADKIVDKRIRRDVKEMLERLADIQDKTEQENMWKDFVKHYRLVDAGGNERRVVKVACNVGSSDEYKDMGKADKTRGQFRKGKKHKAYFILGTKEKPIIKPVYAFQSLHEERKAICASETNIVDIFFPGCLVEVDNEVRSGKTVISPGVYRCTIRTDGYVKLDKNNPINISAIYKTNPNFRQFKRKEKM